MVDETRQEKIVKQVRAFGTGAAVIVPKYWIGERVEISVKTIPWKQELIKLILPYLDKIKGVYLIGSYARGEEKADSDIDILIVAEEQLKIESKRFHISILTSENLDKRSFLKIFLYAALLEAKAILNASLLQELKQKAKPCYKEVKDYLYTTKLGINSIDSLISIDKSEESKYFTSMGVIYSIILRLRGLFILKNSLKGRATSLKEFRKELINKGISKNILEEFYGVYLKEKKDMKIGQKKILLKDVEKIMNILKKWYEQRNKELKLWKKE